MDYTACGWPRPAVAALRDACIAAMRDPQAMREYERWKEERDAGGHAGVDPEPER